MMKTRLNSKVFKNLKLKIVKLEEFHNCLFGSKRSKLTKRMRQLCCKTCFKKCHFRKYVKVRCQVFMKTDIV